jgi:glucan 1,4-alpha-glucosidase
MMKKLLCYLLTTIIFLNGCKKEEIITKISSPNGKISISIEKSEEGKLQYVVLKNNKVVLEKADLGFITKEADLYNNLEITSSKTNSIKEAWKPVWGQNSSIKNEYNELTISAHSASSQQMDIVFKVYDDGLGFRYSFPKGKNENLTFTDEKTTFDFPKDPTTWWSPGCWDNDEYPYTKSKLSKVDGSFYIKGYKYSNVTTITSAQSVNTPVTFVDDDNNHISIHEAALLDFPGMSLLVDTNAFSLKSHLAESDSAQGVKAIVTLPYKTPWRTIALTDDAKSLVSSNLILNLNDPQVLTDVSWIKPTKYMGIWWEMHVGKAAWDLKSGKHGANTANIKSYIDFCAENGIPALLVEGWNTGWEQWVGDDREGIFDFVTPYPDCDMKGVVEYGKSKGVEIIGHHETASAVKTYEKHMDAAYKYYNGLGIKAVKTGYVGKIPGLRHYDQTMVNHYNKTMIETAKHKIMLNIHECIKPTGLTRTYPHLMGGEGMRGQEFNAWSDGNKPSHNVTLPFTRNLAGPMDFTPGIFDLKLEKYKNNVTKVSSFDTRDGGEKPFSRVYSTLAHQLALYVVFYAPIQMAADLPENYKDHPAFQFIRDVVVDWDQSIVLDASVGNHIITARKAKGEDKWFVGGISGDNSVQAKIDFSFLTPGKTYKARIYQDAVDTDYINSPEKYEIKEMEINSKTVLDKKIIPAGGFAISLL